MPGGKRGDFMERLKERIQVAKKALDAFEQVLNLEEDSTIIRDAAIQRFDFTFEACWKATKQFLFDVEGFDVDSPKGVMRAAREVNIFYR